jgi:hypothetical protein
MSATAFEQASEHAWAVLSRLARAGTRGRYRIVLTSGGQTRALHAALAEGVARRLDDSPAPPDVALAFDLDDYLACAAGERTLQQTVFAGRTRVRGERQLALRFAREFEASSARPAQAPVPLAVDAARRPARPRPSEVLAARRPPVERVERLERPDVEAFRRGYVATGTPVILTGALADWELSSWEPARLRREHGDLLGLVRPALPAPGAAPVESAVWSLSELLDALDQPERAGTRYLAYNEVPAPLLASLRHPPYFAREQYQDPPYIWLGPAGTVTHLHRDGSDNLFAQIWGRKSFVLYSPDQRPLLSAWTPAGDAGLDGCDVDPDRPDDPRYPLFREARKVVCVVEPGELLFLPEGWFHHVVSLAPSLSINFWTRSKREAD